MASSTTPRAATLQPSLALTARGANVLSATRMRLLEALDRSGSIAAAARAAGITYKAAWDNISAINNLAEKPVVLRRKGGRGGGGSELTAFGRQLIELYRHVATAQARTAAEFRRRQSSGSGLRTLGVLGLRTSARNQYLGRIRRIHRGALNSEVSLDLGDGLEITSVITRQSVTDLGLRAGGTAVALIKATFVLLANDAALRISARNVLPGTVTRIRRGSVNAEVHVELAGHRSMVATVTLASLRELALRRGARCQAVIKASHVLIAVMD